MVKTHITVVIIPFLGLILYGLDKVTIPSHQIITDMMWFLVIGMAWFICT